MTRPLRIELAGALYLTPLPSRALHNGRSQRVWDSTVVSGIVQQERKNARNKT